MLVLSDYIVKHELKPLKRQFDLKDLMVGAKKALNGLGQEVNFNSGYKFFKVRIGTKLKGG